MAENDGNRNINPKAHSNNVINRFLLRKTFTPFFQFGETQCNDEFTVERLNSGELTGITAVHDQTMDEGRPLTVITLSEEIKIRTFVHVLEYLYNGEYVLHIYIYI